MKAYRITCSTDGYYAARNAKFNGKTSYEVIGGLTLKQAQRKLLDLYNEQYDGERPYAPNWGLAVIQSSPYMRGAGETRRDGTRAFGYDVYTYEIEEVGEEE